MYNWAQNMREENIPSFNIPVCMYNWAQNMREENINPEICIGKIFFLVYNIVEFQFREGLIKEERIEFVMY